MRQMTIPIPSLRERRAWVMRAVLILCLIYVAYVVREIWVPLLLAFLIATVLDPLADRLERRGWSRTMGASLIFTLFFALLIASCVLLFPLLRDQVADIQAGFSKYFPDTSKAGLKKSLADLRVHPSVADSLIQLYQGYSASYAKSSSRLMDFGMKYAAGLIWIVIIPIVAYYALRDFHLILAKSLLLVPRRYRDAVQTGVAETTAIFAKYLRALALISLLNGIATWLLLWALGVQGALVIGIIAGVLYSVPYIGAILTIALTAAVTFLTGGFDQMVVVTGISIVLHQILFDQIIAPRMLGGHVGLHPILSIIALLAGNLMLGIIGMILAVPIAAVIQIGVLALVPKLSHEIELPEVQPTEAEEVEEIIGETKDVHAKIDATEELHRTVTEAVDNIEQKIKEEALTADDDKPKPADA